MPTQICGRRARPFAAGLLTLSIAFALAPDVAAQANGSSEPSDSIKALLARADSARAQLIQPPGEYGGVRAMDLIRVPFQLFGATLALGAHGAGAVYYVLDKTVLDVGRKARANLSEVDVVTDVGSLGARSWPGLILRYEGLSPLFAEVGYSLRQYQHYSAGIRHEGDRLVMEAAGTYRRLREPHFWGVGPDTNDEDRSDFSQDIMDLGGIASWTVADSLTLFGGAAWERSDTGPGWDGGEPDTQDLFGAGTLFGLNAEVEYLRFSAGAELNETDLSDSQLSGFGLSGELDHYEGVGGTPSSFERVAGSARFFVPVNERTEIALRLLAEDHFGESGAGVPFTYLAQLGGERGLRGYSSRRFRDLAMAAGQLEWRYETYWHPGFENYRMEGFVFVDAGNVGPSLTSIQLDELHVTPGFGLRFLDRGRSRGEVYVGFGGDHARVGFELGSTF